jgi:hypothetical protein
MESERKGEKGREEGSVWWENISILYKPCVRKKIFDIQDQP